MATYLTRTQVPGTSRKIFTVSMWIKKTENSAGHEQYLFHTWLDGNTRFMIALQNDDTLQIRERSSGSTTLQIDTNRKFRDLNCFYHILVRVDTTQSTAADRIRMYINGVQETSFSGASYPSQNLECRIGTGSFTNYLGNYGGGGNNFSGVASHWHYVDGQSLAPTVFGSTDSTTGEWKINTSPSGITYGNNGFFLFKDDNSVNDNSGEGHNFTLASGTLTKTEDNPSNVFCTMNPLDAHASMLFANGNTTTVSPSNTWMPCKATIGMLGQNGKFYWEGKCLSGTNHYFGVYDASGTVRGSVQSDMDSNRFVYTYAGSIERTITGQSAIGSGTYATFANNDIIGVGLDKEMEQLLFGKMEHKFIQKHIVAYKLKI